MSATTSKNFQFTDLGAFDKLDQYELFVPKMGRTIKGKVFLKELLGMTGMEVSINKLPAGVAVPFWHRHTHNEELYIILSGQGEFWIDDESVQVQEGSAFVIQPEARRTWRNTSETAPLVYLIVQARRDSLQSSGTTADGAGVDEPLPW